MPYFPKEIRHPAARSLIFRMKSLPGKGVVIAEREEFAGEVGEEFGGNTELPKAIEKKIHKYAGKEELTDQICGAADRQATGNDRGG